jgi:hypothetical protein
MTRSFLSVFFLTLFGLMIGLSPAHTAVFNVSNGQELQNALDDAGDNDDDDVINLAAGTYQSSNNFTYTAFDVSSLTLNGDGAETTLLQGNGTDTLLFVDMSGINDAGLQLVFRGMRFEGGSFAGAGGGLKVDANSANISVESCFFKDNESGPSGGGLDIVTEMGDIALTNNIFSDNSAGDDDSVGGGANLFTGSGTINVIHNTFFDNLIFSIGMDAGGGGGLSITLFDSGSEANIHNNVFFNNRRQRIEDQVPDDIILFDGAAGTNYLITHNAFSELVNFCDFSCSVTETDNLLDVDPLFLDAANDDFGLNENSPVIDEGTSNVPGGLPATDFAEAPRVSGPAPDMGALEFQVVAPSPTPTATPDGDNGGGCNLNSETSANPHIFWLGALFILWLLALSRPGKALGERNHHGFDDFRAGRDQ